jgi:hypothetical protein
MRRTKAALIHLGISATIGSVILCLMVFLWYPFPYFAAMGGEDLVLLLVGVDIALGPIITLIIFDTQKKSLWFDLSVVAAVQLAALIYGTSVMFQARPVFTVFNDNRFDVIIAADVSDKEHAKVTDKAFQTIPVTGPRVVSMKTVDRQETQRMMFSGINTRAFTQHYLPYEAHAATAAKSSRSIADLQANDAVGTARVKAYLSSKRLDEAKVGYLPVYTRNRDMIALLDRSNGFIHGFLLLSTDN